MMMQRMLSVALVAVGLTHVAAEYSRTGFTTCNVDSADQRMGAADHPEESRHWRLLTPAMGSLHPGQKVPFSIVNDEMKRNSKYKGFLIHATDENDDKIGEFNVMGSGFKECGTRGGADTITHTNSNYKDGKFQFEWMAPMEEHEEIHFEVMVVGENAGDWHIINRSFRIVDNGPNRPGTCRADDSTFDIGYGHCDTYAIGEKNHQYCDQDRANTPCCIACDDRNGGRCNDDMSFFGDYGGCDTYEKGKINHQHCALDRVQDICGCACGAGNGLCEDDITFVGDYGRCATYFPGQVNHQHCALDKVTDTCCEACSGGQACHDDPSFRSPYGDCHSYAIGQPNHPHCQLDGVEDECCDACQGMNQCHDDMTFRGNYGTCETYKAGNVNHPHCVTDGVQDTCCAACNTGATNAPVNNCQDSQSFMGEHGHCATYAQGNPNHAFCAQDGVMQTCCQSCSNDGFPNNNQNNQVPNNNQMMDDVNWSGEHGNCLSYAKGTPNHAHCAKDGVMQICGFSCQN